VFDNVAFPLRQHTDFSEAKIAEIVRERLTDVGLADALDDLPSSSPAGCASAPGSRARW
jgi:phospholipid/cholesterol/gamma-HCH transport system ATP-binding protein